MTPTLILFLFLAAEPGAEKRARASVEASAAAERNAEAAYAKGDLDAVKVALKSVGDDMEAAQKAFEESGKTPGRHPGTYKVAEQRSSEILHRLEDLEHKMDDEERVLVAEPKAKVQAIHDEWFEGIMGKKK
jgi:hypothetical protein